MKAELKLIWDGADELAGGADGGANGESAEGPLGCELAGGGMLWNTSLVAMRTLKVRRPWAITERKLLSVPSMMVPRSSVTSPEGSCSRTSAAGSFVVIHAGMKLGSKPRSFEDWPLSTAASGTSIFSDENAMGLAAGPLAGGAAGNGDGMADWKVCWAEKGRFPSFGGSGVTERCGTSNEATGGGDDGKGGAWSAWGRWKTGTMGGALLPWLPGIGIRGPEAGRAGGISGPEAGRSWVLGGGANGEPAAGGEKPKDWGWTGALAGWPNIEPPGIEAKGEGLAAWGLGAASSGSAGAG